MSEELIFTAPNDVGDYCETIEPTLNLRWCDGVLQQQFRSWTRGLFWRDVPSCVSDESPKGAETEGLRGEAPPARPDQREGDALTFTPCPMPEEVCADCGYRCGRWTETPTSNMIERVKQAIQAAKISGQRVLLSDDYAEVMARAAIEAMREPTEAMLEAGSHENGTRVMRDDLVDQIWTDMIDAALASTGEAE